MGELKRNWTVHILHHTHLDIGYTHTQEEVLSIQNQHLNTAMDLIDRFKSKSEDERFRWNPEITWAIEDFVKNASKDELQRFIGYVQEGYVGLDGLYGNVLTGLTRPEEMMASFRSKKSLEELTKTKIDSAMITDIPGWNWGFVTALAENGIKYLSAGPNLSDRIGRIRDFNDKPFYWESPSRQEKVLVWVHGKGYSWFHTGLNSTKNLSRKLTPKRIKKYLQKLEKSGYPYSDVIIRYNIGQDNGPACDMLSDIATKWNQQYPEMKLVISTTSKAFKKFEDKYKDSIPTMHGDITPFWEDGAASTARETALARETGERLTQLETVASLLGSDIDVTSEWKKVFLYNEHTWGAHNSISKPDHPFAISQWNWKKKYAIDSHKNTQNMFKEVTGYTLLNKSCNDVEKNTKIKTSGNIITIVNTQSFDISDLIYIDTNYQGINYEGKEVPSQKLSDGRLVIKAESIPALGSKVYELTNKPYVNKMAKKDDLLTISSNGTIESLIYKGQELISSDELLNSYVFQKGKWGGRISKYSPKNVEISTIDSGELATIYKITKDEYKTNSIETYYYVNHFTGFVTIENIVDRPVSRRKEGIHFELPFNIPNGRIKYDTMYGSCEVDKEQLQGSNKNFITSTRWVDISNEDIGVSIALLDAPMFKPGKIYHDPIRMGDPDLCGWKKETSYNGKIYSYIMNNYWMTNYKADQPGKTVFRYVLKPHDKYNETDTHKFALQVFQPLLVFDGKIEQSSETMIDNKQIIITNIHNNDVRLFNTSLKEETFKLTNDMRIASPNKAHKLEDGSITLNPKEVILLTRK